MGRRNYPLGSYLGGVRTLGYLLSAMVLTVGCSDRPTGIGSTSGGGSVGSSSSTAGETGAATAGTAGTAGTGGGSRGATGGSGNGSTDVTGAGSGTAASTSTVDETQGAGSTTSGFGTGAASASTGPVGTTGGVGLTSGGTGAGGTGVATTGSATTGLGTGGTTAGTGGVVSTGGTAGGALDCGGVVYACGDGMDNDGDGKTDAADPECIGPCDDDEGSFQTGIPGDNMDCWQDCFFDGNSGHGDDGCRWNLKCDPQNPGANVGCEYTGRGNCSGGADTPQECIDFCAPLTPNGCDCFGCCTVPTQAGDVNIFLNSGPNCSIQNIAECQPCTPNEDCGNPCEPENCEVCFGSELPESCDTPECPPGFPPCVVDDSGVSDCAEGEYCITGCCVAIVG